MRLLVCGGRNYNDPELLFDRLDKLTYGLNVEVLIHGAATGADTLSESWAQHNDIPTIPVPADWRTHGKAAGPIRNQQMLEYHPDLVIAFPGGNGTNNMVRLAKTAGIRVIRIDE